MSSRKKSDEMSKEINKARIEQNVKVNEDTFEDFNPLDVLPEVINKDYGFFLMFGNPDIFDPGNASNNLDSERHVDWGTQK